MTNEEIIQCVRSKYVTEGQVTMYTVEQIGLMLNMLREKMQGVDCWVSWDATDDSDIGNWESPVISIKEPAKNTTKSGRIYYTGLGQNITISKGGALKLGLQQSQCKKFRIVGGGE